MKIILVGATGTIGKAIDQELSQAHEVIRVSKSKSDYLVDLTDEDSIRALFEKVGEYDALVSAAGNVHFGDLADMTSKEYEIGLRDKLMGQVNLVLIGKETIRDGGSFTLTSGVLNEDPIRMGSSAAMVNGALAGFITGASIEMPRGIRLNLVSPTVVEEAWDAYGPFFPGFKAVPTSLVAKAYHKSVAGLQTGQIYRVY